MEAVVFDGSSLNLYYQKDYPLPKLENDDDVIVKVHYSGICGTDLHIIQGEFPAIKTRPIPLGHESSGVIHQGNYQYCLTAGINSTIGIWKDGGWAQYVRVPQSQVFALPEGITTEQAGLCEPYSCVSHGFDRASPLKVGDKILILGAGIIGNLWITTLHHHGHREVTVSEMNPTRLDIVKRLGKKTPMNIKLSKVILTLIKTMILTLIKTMTLTLIKTMILALTLTLNLA
ncbi:hypothetical protein HF086_014770 [Spodoptera exigua]|uniref:Alcohol dehydrogenase-like N-terminal domain-containing protein n=1 Tax=Spodoptera exigua TaxID=7107 RepID=A0A922SH68_SPOEX|nr:hypothetical protein HF086_014770 [Spodoptera exigua]